MRSGGSPDGSALACARGGCPSPCWHGVGPLDAAHRRGWRRRIRVDSSDADRSRRRVARHHRVFRAVLGVAQPLRPCARRRCWASRAVPLHRGPVRSVQSGSAGSDGAPDGRALEHLGHRRAERRPAGRVQPGRDGARLSRGGCHRSHGPPLPAARVRRRRARRERAGRAPRGRPFEDPWSHGDGARDQGRGRSVRLRRAGWSRVRPRGRR